jgi:hypothetical protein
MDNEHKDSIDGKQSTDTGGRRNGSFVNPERSVHDEENVRRRPSRNKYDDPFGDETNNEVKYRTMTWWQVAVTMMYVHP